MPNSGNVKKIAWIRRSLTVTSSGGSLPLFMLVKETDNREFDEQHDGACYGYCISFLMFALDRERRNKKESAETLVKKFTSRTHLYESDVLIFQKQHDSFRKTISQTVSVPRAGRAGTRLQSEKLDDFTDLARIREAEFLRHELMFQGHTLGVPAYQTFQGFLITSMLGMFRDTDHNYALITKTPTIRQDTSNHYTCIVKKNGVYIYFDPHERDFYISTDLDALTWEIRRQEGLHQVVRGICTLKMYRAG